MTITSTSSRQDYTGDGVSVAFAVPFPFFDQTEIRVVERVIATGAETTLVLGSSYTVSGGGGAVGVVTALVAPAATKQWSILRNTRRTQEVDYLPNDPFPAETHERALDRLTAEIQENERDGARALRIPETDPSGSLTLPSSVDRALMTLGFDAAGNPVAVTPDAGSLVVTAFMQSVLASTDALTARQGLGIVWAGTFGGTANALTGSVLPIVVARQASQIVRGLVGTTNTATNPTLVLNGLASGTIKAADGNPIWPGALRAGCVADFLDDGTNYRLLNPALPLAVDASLAASQSIPASTSTALVMGTPGKDDIGAFAGGSPSRLTMAVAGRVRVTASVNWGSGTTASHILEIWKNGATTGFTSTLPTNAAVGQAVSAEFEVAAADYIQAIVFQDTAGALAATAAKIALTVVR